MITALVFRLLPLLTSRLVPTSGGVFGLLGHLFAKLLDALHEALVEDAHRQAHGAQVAGETAQEGVVGLAGSHLAGQVLWSSKHKFVLTRKDKRIFLECNNIERCCTNNFRLRVCK